ncbi:hypothetical protein Ahy_B10g102971 [Arachis hypogaea]|uniref:FAR1 domain-containing protein n=1 Tax=Arachis hypogaea TaxID=3818 RepID=A0A444X345_ARAHY|nr:hypothetical protein Ahy_B10g102971 [Arachis hypogaea]
MNNINHESISTSTNHESTIPDPEDGLLNEVPSHVSIEDVLKIELFTPGEAREFYTSYSRLKGFAIRKSKRVKNAKREIVRYTFVCNRQRFRHKKWLEKRAQAYNSMRFVSQFVDDHNHTLLSERFIGYLLSHRNISNVEIAQMNSLKQVGISIPKIYQSFAMQVGGFNLIRFTKQDMHNEVRKQHAL